MKFEVNRSRFQLALAAGLLAMLACTTLFPSFSEDANPETNTSSDPWQLDCRQLDYPCSLAEADPEALDRSNEVMKQAEQIYLEQGSLLAAGERLIENDEVVELAYDERGLWFRVRGAPPMWLWDFDDIVDSPADAAASPASGAPLARPAAQDSGPIGEQTPGEEPEKRARLVLPWAYTMHDDSAALAGILSGHRNYQCPNCIDQQVTRQDPKAGEPDEAGYYGPSLERFMGWSAYDLIYVYSHGRHWCGVPDEETGGYFVEGRARPIGECAGMLTTGRFRQSIYDDAGTLDTPGVTWGRKPGDDWWIEALSPDFFRAEYSGGLDDSLFFFNSCQLLKNDSFSSALIGQDSAVVGWTESVKVSRGVASADTLFTTLVEDGLRLEKALAETKESQAYNVEETYAGAELTLEGNRDARAVEIITWMHPVYQQEVEQIGSLPVEGIPGDGQPDQLIVRFRVDGVDEDQQPSSFQIHVKIGERELDETLTPQTKTGDYRYEIRELIDLDFDVNGREESSFEAWIDLPSGGQSRHYLEDQNLASCGWTGTLSGAQSGEIKGDIALNLADFGELDSAQLQALVDQGLMDSMPAIPDAANQSSAPDTIFLTGEDAYPALMASAAGGAFLMQSLNDVGFPTTQAQALSFSEQSADRFEGSINANLLDPISQGNFTAAADFIWNAGSFCDIDLILEAAKLGSDAFGQ